MGRKSQFSNEQIIKAVREVDAGAKAADVCRKLGVTETTLARWRRKFDGMDVSEAKQPLNLAVDVSQTWRILICQMADPSKRSSAWDWRCAA